jgi:hypothetical protein
MQDGTTPSVDYGSSERAPIFPYWGWSERCETFARSQQTTDPRALAGLIVRLRSRRIIARISVAIAPFVCEMAASTALFERARTNCDAFPDH